MLWLGVEVEMSKFPLVRISSQKHIEELRSGQLFLRHVTFYQRMESNDNARSDVFDGSIPFPDNGTLASIAKEDVKNGRIMNLTSYVACFYHFHCEKNGYFYVPEEDKPALREFKRDTAFIIDADDFESRVKNACDKGGISSLMGDVFYISPQQEIEIKDQLQNGYIPKIIHIPQFVKSSKFSNQHEYRVSVDCTPDYLKLHSKGEPFLLDAEEFKGLSNSTKTINIGSIEDISDLVTVEELLSSYFREEA